MPRPSKASDKPKRKAPTANHQPAVTFHQENQVVAQQTSILHQQDQVVAHQTSTLPQQDQVPTAQPANFENFEVFRSELERAENFNEVYTLLNVNMETLYNIARGRFFLTYRNEGPSDASTAPLATLLEEKQAEETSPQPNMNVEVKVPLATLLEEKQAEETSQHPNRNVEATVPLATLLHEKQAEETPPQSNRNVEATVPLATLLQEKQAEGTSPQPNRNDIAQEQQHENLMETGEILSSSSKIPDLNVNQNSEEHLSEGDRPEFERMHPSPYIDQVSIRRPKTYPYQKQTPTSSHQEQILDRGDSFLRQSRPRNNLFLGQIPPTRSLNGSNVPISYGLPSEETIMSPRLGSLRNVENSYSKMESNARLMSMPSNLFGLLRNFLLYVWGVVYDIIYDIPFLF